MKLKYYPHTLKLRKHFTLSVGTRTTTPSVMVEVEHDGFTGYGEASLPPYLVEDQSSVLSFLGKVKLDSFNDPTTLNLIIDYIDNIEEGNNAAKAAIDIALHDLLGKILDIPLHKYLNIPIRDDIYTSYTIGISNEDEIKQKIDAASEFKFLKVKLGTANDREIISTIRTISDKPLFVDVNQGWTDKYFALDMIMWLGEQNVVLIEQPMPKRNYNDASWLIRKKSRYQ